MVPCHGSGNDSLRTSSEPSGRGATAADAARGSASGRHSPEL